MKKYRCSYCGYWDIFVKYDKNEDDEWIKKMYCPLCHTGKEELVSDEESLEEFADRISQRIGYSIWFDIITAFKNNREPTDNWLLDFNDDRIKINIVFKQVDNGEWD